MAASFPYTHYACPCSSNTPPANASEAVESAPFNPHDPRSQYCLFPIDHLLYCDECDAPRCSRCVTEEVLNWYCPNCLFEVPSSSVRSEGNRCSRNCFECPICEAPVSVTSIPGSHPSPSLERSASSDYLRLPDLRRPREKDEDAGSSEYILQCGYCDWSTLDIGVRLPKAAKIGDQLSKMRKARATTKPVQRNRSLDTSVPEQDEGAPADTAQARALEHDEAFTNLSNFYKTQLNEAPGEGHGLYASTNSPYSSPANIARIMSLYNTGSSSFSALKKSREKPQPFGEAASREDGLSAYYPQSRPETDSGETITFQPIHDDQDILAELQSLGLDNTVTSHQRLSAPQSNAAAKFLSDLWPIATKLRTKRGKRCRTCRQFLVRPEPKIPSLRYKIRLVAGNYLPRLSTKLLNAAAPAVVGSASFRLREEDLALDKKALLSSGTALQYILTVRNPIFETIKVSLATPSATPGRVSSRVTILCPSFTVGPAGDVWEEALGSSTSGTSSSDGGRRAALASLNGGADGTTGERVPEAGKIWDKTRNSTSVVMEIVPGTLGPEKGADGEDDDVLEVPIFVHVEWTAHPQNDAAGMEKKGERERLPGREIAADGSEEKELGVWCVLGLGRIGR